MMPLQRAAWFWSGNADLPPLKFSEFEMAASQG
jgi:hypothetical protein